MFYYFLDGHTRSNLHVSLPIRDFIRLVRGNSQSRESTKRKSPYRAQPSVTTQVRKGASKGGGSKGRFFRRHIRLIHGASHRIHGIRQVRRILGIDH